MTITVISTAFLDGRPIPREHTCQGSDRSPPLAWSGLPDATKAIALILDDPDAPRGTWTHWTFWDLPAGIMSLPSGVDVAALGARQGKTTAGTLGYHGPCPPSGTHRYFVHVYALSKTLGLPSGATIETLKAALEGAVLAQGELMGTYAQS